MMTASPEMQYFRVRSPDYEALLTWRNILPVDEPSRVGNYTLTREKVVGSRATLARCQSERTDTVRVSERDDPETSEHRDTGVGTFALLHEASDRGEDIFLVDTELARLLQVVGEDVEKEFRVGGGVDVSVSGGVHEMQKFGGVD